MSEFLVYNAIFGDGHFERIALGNMLNKGGAAGKIYACPMYPDMVAKIFHDRSKSKTNRQKLEAMIQNKPNIPIREENGKKYVQIAWPEAVLEDDEGFCTGYLMPLINTDEAVSLDHLMQKAVRQKEHLSEKYTDRLTAALNVTGMVMALHQCGHHIVDLKPANVSVYKDNMFVAIYDCDGFSINGQSARYPAEFVSEEYIYPEGMHENPEDMGEEQDKFALAVIIFKLLNNGIHPFSGTLRNKEDEKTDIQTRIEQYHYAYGMWPDKYQAPHPYSMHEYFDKSTLDMFERAFSKNGKRPTAKEWFQHLNYLCTILQPCKKDKNHFYFTNKGCGLCAVEQKFKLKLSDVAKEKQEQQKVRGFGISNLTSEKTRTFKQMKQQALNRLNKLAVLLCAVHLGLWTILPIYVAKFKDIVSSRGYFLQLLVGVLILKAVFVFFNKMQTFLPLLQNAALLYMLKLYAVFNAVVCFFVVNGISWTLLR
ncbi:MAG: hypothetical protein J5896_04770 [Alphaproteobacteria bacterium]|nr:hypothetical protein [Alphaproteobacteria bacterium]